LTAEEAAEWEAWEKQHEEECDPPDSAERQLVRLIATARGEPDPYGTDGLDEAERRRLDWSDWHMKRTQSEAQVQ
jgi:hypothetical protein